MKVNLGFFGHRISDRKVKTLLRFEKVLKLIFEEKKKNNDI